MNGLGGLRISNGEFTKSEKTSRKGILRGLMGFVSDIFSFDTDTRSSDKAKFVKVRVKEGAVFKPLTEAKPRVSRREAAKSMSKQPSAEEIAKYSRRAAKRKGGPDFTNPMEIALRASKAG